MHKKLMKTKGEKEVRIKKKVRRKMIGEGGQSGRAHGVGQREKERPGREEKIFLLSTLTLGRSPGIAELEFPQQQSIVAFTEC